MRPSHAPCLPRRGAWVVMILLVTSLGVLGAPIAEMAEPAGAQSPSVGVTTLSGSGGSGQTDGPAGTATFGTMIDMASSTDGSTLYVLESGAIRTVSTATGEVDTLSTDPLLSSSPTNIQIDSNGDPWVALRLPDASETDGNGNPVTVRQKGIGDCRAAG